ncbi:hypothetical protein QBC39DRAFT_333710 [Podospora conica]|nr:hypothetical protein QBC39DRAFT_333710 [Schizothecium conicum]
MATTTAAPTAASAAQTIANLVIRQAWFCLRFGGPWPRGILPYTKALPSMGALGLVVDGMGLAFPPDLYQVLFSSATPPTIEWLRGLSTDTPGIVAPAWGVYMILLEQPEGSLRPRIYIGSRTAMSGVSSRIWQHQTGI